VHVKIWAQKIVRLGTGALKSADLFFSDIYSVFGSLAQFTQSKALMEDVVDNVIKSKECFNVWRKQRIIHTE